MKPVYLIKPYLDLWMYWIIYKNKNTMFIMANIVFTLKEKDGAEKDKITYETLLKDIEEKETAMDDFVAMEVDYFENYTLKELEKIGGYYDIPRKRKKKKKYIREIVQFEKNIENEEIVYRRKLMWSYMQELLEDKYLSKFIVFN